MIRACSRQASLFLLAVLLAGVFSCATTPPPLYDEGGKPLSITDYEKLAQKEYENGRYENAIQVYQAIIDHYPENQNAVAWAHYEIGYCHYMRGEYDRAEQYFRTVLNRFQEPAARTLATQMLERIREQRT
ncbi:MAG: tetratricopeptide repeat protein [Spirochaetota bacterium]